MKIGFDIGGSHISAGLIDDEYKIIEKQEISLKEISNEELIKYIEKNIIEIYTKYSEKYEITKIGISIPGTVEKNYIKKAVNLDIENYDLKFNLEKVVKCEIVIRNDVKNSALAELEFGNLQNKKRNVFLTLGTGIGGAVIIDNKVLEGSEFGHMIINQNGLDCSCGNKGCWEQYASMKAFKKMVVEQYNNGEYINSKEILDLLNDKKIKRNNEDIYLEKIVDKYIENILVGLINIINILEPDIIGLGGSFSYFEDIFIPKLNKKIQSERLTLNNRKDIEIVSAKLKNDAGIIGAVL